MATEVISTIIPAGGGDYTSLAAWEADRQGDFVTADEIDVAECHAGSTSESFFVGGSTTDQAHYREIRAAAGQAHAFTISSSDTAAASIIQFDDDLRIKDIILKSGSQTSGFVLTQIAAADYYVTNCFIVVENSAVGYIGGGAKTGGRVTVLRNNIFYGSANMFPITLNTGHYTYNNTIIVSGLRGVFNGGTELYNNIVQGATSLCYDGAAATASGGNISSDATSPQAGLRNISLTFADAANDDYHLNSMDAEAIDAGMDLSAATFAFNFDIDGEVRSDGAWDIGADEFFAAGSFGTIALLTRRRRRAA